MISFPIIQNAVKTRTCKFLSMKKKFENQEMGIGYLISFT